MPKLALNFICKNESHVIERMLNSIVKVTDLIVCNDTGSTDGTQQMIKNWGEKNNIPTYVFERPFDNFENSRNHAMSKLRDTVSELGWDPNDVWGYWIDCDEQLVVYPDFNKSQFDRDLYMINTSIGAMKYTRNTFFRVSKPFAWYGPVHEFIIYTGQDQITSGLAVGLDVDVRMDGGSWKTDVSEKYKNHANILEDYITKNNDPRWVFYTAQSWHDAASIQNNREENEERWRRSIKYYRQRVARNDGYEEERYYSQLRIGSIMRIMEAPWEETHQELLKAYSLDPLRGESIKLIADHYLMMGEFNLAYLYTKFCKVNFHGKNPYPNRLLFIDESFYVWRILEVHAAACYYTGRVEEAKANYNELIDVLKKNPKMFSPEDIQKINANAQFFK
jgi:glycosyltransferase involved in cell wall biosynthesis